jgi:ribose transport system substrate-binding protein
MLLLLALTLGVAGCGSSGSSASSGSGSVDPAAKAAVDQHTKNPTKIGPTAPVGKPIPTGKKVVVVSCGQPGCNDTVYAFQQAAKVLGWNVSELTPPQPTPELIQQVMGQAVSANPDAVVVTSTALVNFQQQAAALAKKNIPLITAFGVEPVGGPVTMAISTAQQEAKFAALAADKITVDLGGKGTVGVVGLSGFPSVTEFIKGFYSELKKVCSGCKTKQVTIQPSALGSSSGTDISNFLRANPDVNAVMLGFEGLGGGLSAAAGSAGIKLPPSYSIVATVSGLPDLESGARTATIPNDFTVVGWQIADALARIFTGQTTSAQTEDAKLQQPVIWSKAYHNIPTVPAGAKYLPAFIPDYQDQFKKLWGK